MILPELFLEIKSFGAQNAIELGIIAFSLVLCGLSINAYRTTGLKKLVYAATAFALFAIQLFFEYIEEAYDFFADDQTDIVVTSTTLSILVLLFLAIVKKK